MSSESDEAKLKAAANIEKFKIKKLIRSLEVARGNGTSMISLIVPPKDQIARVAKMLAEEYGTASNIKSRVNRQSVLEAIVSTQQRLKVVKAVPPNGLVVYCGTVYTEDGKEKKVTIDFEPFKPINTSLYLCDNKFHTEPLRELLEDDSKYGFIVMDGNGCLYGTLSGNHRSVIHKFGVDLPKKHRRGGQSALRFARLRVEARHNYVRKVAEAAKQIFISNDKVNCSGIILAGSAAFKNDLAESDLFDNRLVKAIIQVVDVSYGGENGFNQAIELAGETLSNVKFVQEKKLISSFFDEINRDTGKFCFGIRDTLHALDLSAMKTLIVHENLDANRYVMRNNSTGEEFTRVMLPREEKDANNFKDASTGIDFEVMNKEPFVEWLAENYTDFGATLEFVTDKSAEGAQFCRGFGGVGGILRWGIDFMELDGQLAGDEDSDDEFFM
eukprot:TRINITY_DN774400_c0_g1_i1.p1 TRINITY_DN774400_c0_g1~~TRINITY_DN774400_c0_g1_i1.p1  ORF type:complete len:443 (-),score=180.62 TRINITY_DN774400_c0_g1_i1:282-1610(-)